MTIMILPMIMMIMIRLLLMSIIIMMTTAGAPRPAVMHALSRQLPRIQITNL
jgi:hypothetical protein